MNTYYTYNRVTRRPTGEIQSIHKPQYASDIPPPDALEGHYVAYDIIGRYWVQIPTPMPVVPTQAEIDAREALALLTQTDTDMSRTTEDLIDSLIAAGTIAMTDLPQASQDRIAARKLARSLI